MNSAPVHSPTTRWVHQTDLNEHHFSFCQYLLFQHCSTDWESLCCNTYVIMLLWLPIQFVPSSLPFTSTALILLVLLHSFLSAVCNKHFFKPGTVHCSVNCIFVLQGWSYWYKGWQVRCTECICFCKVG